MSPRAKTLVEWTRAGCVLCDGLAFQQDDAIERLRLAWERAGRPVARLAVENGPADSERLVVEPCARPGGSAAPPEAPAEPSKTTSAEPFEPW